MLTQPSKQTAPARAPDVAGPAARAWKIRMPERDPASTSCVGAYLVHAPWSHPFWPWKVLSLVMLRAVPGLPPAKVFLVGATHELMLMPINPEHPLGDPDTAGPFAFLIPPDLVEQVQCSGDERAGKLLDELVRRIVEGYLVPDSDYRSHWHAVLAAELEREP